MNMDTENTFLQQSSNDHRDHHLSPPATAGAASIFESSPPLSPPEAKGGDQNTDEPAWLDDEKLYRGADYEKDNDSIIADELAEVLKNELCFDDTGNEWFSQTAGLWKVISKKRATKKIMGALSRNLPNGFSMSKLNSMESFLTINLLLDKWEESRNLLPMKNGVLNVKTGELTAYSNKHRFNWQLPYCYDKHAEIKVVLEWLIEASGGDQEAVNIIRAFFKIALFGGGGEIQKFLEVVGAGGTGKSALIRLLMAMVGEQNCVATDLKNLECNKFEVAALYGKRLAIIGDATRYGGEVTELKKITGGDISRLEKKNQQQTGGFVYGGVVVMVSNEPIQTSDYTSGLMRRRMPIMFNRKVTDADKAKWSGRGGIEKAMQSELAGLLNWALGMTDAEVSAVIGSLNGEMTATQRIHLIDTNKIAEWLDSNTEIVDGEKSYIGKSTVGTGMDKNEIELLVRTKIYSNYERWCIESNCHPVAFNRFSKNVLDVCEHLKIQLIKAEDKKGAFISGITIRSEAHTDLPKPVTRQFITDEDSVKNSKDGDQMASGGDRVAIESLGSGGGGDGGDVNSVVEIDGNNGMMF